jgi:hypothetical protein
MGGVLGRELRQRRPVECRRSRSELLGPGPRGHANTVRGRSYTQKRNLPIVSIIAWSAAINSSLSRFPGPDVLVLQSLAGVICEGVEISEERKLADQAHDTAVAVCHPDQRNFNSAMSCRSWRTMPAQHVAIRYCRLSGRVSVLTEMRKDPHQAEVVMPAWPECGAEGVPIVYGMPGPELIAEREAGQVVLGGCESGPDDPTWACKGPVQHEWAPEAGSMQDATALEE